MTDFIQNHPDGVILAMDEMSLYLQATVTKAWSPVGQTPEVYVVGSREHLHVYGALNVRSGFQFALPSLVQSTDTTLSFLHDLLLIYPAQPILLFLDRAPWHTAKVVTAFLAAHPRLSCVHFPPACPNLNPQEHVWSQARAAISHNHTFRDFDSLKNAFLSYLASATFSIRSLLNSAPPVLTAFLGQS